MQSTLITAARATVLAVSVGLTAGCPTTGDLEEVRGIANNALSTAQAAQQTAGAAQAAADNATAVAQEAQASADAAQACCLDVAERAEMGLKKRKQ